MLGKFRCVSSQMILLIQVNLKLKTRLKLHLQATSQPAAEKEVLATIASNILEKEVNSESNIGKNLKLVK